MIFNVKMTSFRLDDKRILLKTIKLMDTEDIHFSVDANSIKVKSYNSTVTVLNVIELHKDDITNIVFYEKCDFSISLKELLKVLEFYKNGCVEFIISKNNTNHVTIITSSYLKDGQYDKTEFIIRTSNRDKSDVPVVTYTYEQSFVSNQLIKSITCLHYMSPHKTNIEYKKGVLCLHASNEGINVECNLNPVGSEKEEDNILNAVYDTSYLHNVIQFASFGKFITIKMMENFPICFKMELLSRSTITSFIAPINI